MAQNIQQFYKTAKNRDFSRDFLLRVTNMNVSGLPSITQDDLVYVKAASLPGRSINNIEVPYMGLNFNVPGSVMYDGSDSYELTFYLDDPGQSQNDLRSKFETASRNLFDDLTSSGLYQVPGNESTITLTLLNKNLGDTGKFFQLVGVSLRKVDAIEYKIAEGKGETLELKVTLAYHYYTTNEFPDRAVTQ
jgi:hypothetical protein